MSEIWMNHLSVQSWTDPESWATLFSSIEKVLGSSLTHLDASDPVRRRVGSMEEAANYVSTFRPADDSRWVFGKFEELGIEFSVQHYRRIGHWPNSLIWHMPSTFFSGKDGYDYLKSIFQISNSTTSPFYAFADNANIIKNKKKARGAVDIRAELLGIFWITHFSSAYVNYFGASKLKEFPIYDFDKYGGTTLFIADKPEEVPPGAREAFEKLLGAESFFDSSCLRPKLPGQFALTFEDIWAFQRSHLNLN